MDDVLVWKVTTICKFQENLFSQISEQAPLTVKQTKACFLCCCCVLSSILKIICVKKSNGGPHVLSMEPHYTSISISLQVLHKKQKYPHFLLRIINGSRDETFYSSFWDTLYMSDLFLNAMKPNHAVVLF